MRDAKNSGISNIILLGDFNTKMSDKNYLLRDIEALEGFRNLWSFKAHKNRISHRSGLKQLITFC